MKDAITNLLKVKSLITLSMSAVFAYLAITGRIDTKDVMTVYLMITTFYFGTQSAKLQNKVSELEDLSDDEGEII